MQWNFLVFRLKMVLSVLNGRMVISIIISYFHQHHPLAIDALLKHYNQKSVRSYHGPYNHSHIFHSFWFVSFDSYLRNAISIKIITICIDMRIEIWVLSSVPLTRFQFQRTAPSKLNKPT